MIGEPAGVLRDAGLRLDGFHTDAGGLFGLASASLP
jgi:hypothetical protein